MAMDMVDRNLNRNIPVESSTPRTDQARYGMKASDPAPGGPDPRRDSTDLRTEMLKDIAANQEKINTTFSRLGVETDRPAFTKDFREKGIKIAGKQVADKELKRALQLQDQAVSDYVKAAGFVDEMDINVAKNEINKRLNDLRANLLKKAYEAKKRLEKANASAEQKRRAAKLFGQLAGTAVGAVIGGVPGAFAGGSIGSAIGGGFG
jgi:hypothetical protein